MKYIDADKLKAEIKRYKNKADERLKIKGRSYAEENKDSALQNLCGNLLYFISSLQKEQPESDIEKEIHEYIEKEFGERWDGCVPISCFDLVVMANYFYKLGLKARKEE